MQQQVQKMMAKKKVLEKMQEQQIIAESRDKATNNIENCKCGIFLKTRQNPIKMSKTRIYEFFFVFSAYRGHTIRMKRWLPEIEQKIKYAFNVMKNENEAVQYLLNLGLTTHEIDLVLQHFLSNAESNWRKQEKNQQMEARNPLTVQEQQLELIGFSQSVIYFPHISIAFYDVTMIFY